MQQPVQSYLFPYITPVSCPDCGASAHLMRRTPDPSVTVPSCAPCTLGGEPPRIRIISDNKSHDPEDVGIDEISIVGRVLWGLKRL